MCKSEIFFRLLSLTEQETEVTRDRILGDYNDMEATDARYVRHLMRRNITSPMIGIYLSQIRKRMGSDA